MTKHEINCGKIMRKKVLVTGGCGKIGSHFVRHAASKYQLRVADLQKCGFEADVEIITGDLNEFEHCLNLCTGIDTIIHLAGNPDPDQNFEEVLTSNIIPTRNIFAAAYKQRCSRIIYASSAQAVEAFPPDVQPGTDTIRPKNLYGVSKCFGEALASYYAYNKELSSICLRIGAFEFPEDHKKMDTRDLSAYLHPDDMNRLLIACIEAQNIKFEKLNAISNNTYKRLDITQTRKKVGYNPARNAFDIFDVLSGVENRN